MTNRKCSTSVDSGRYVITANRMVRPDVWLLSFRSPAIRDSIRPGQFLHVRVPNASDSLLRRPFSIHDVSGGSISILYRVVGAGTLSLSRLRTGTTVDVAGPFGTPFSIDPGARGHVIVAGGIGIAPMQFLLRRLRSMGISPLLYYGCPTRSDLLPHLKVKRTVTTDDGSCGTKGYVTIALERAIDRLTGTAVYACGPWPMLQETARICLGRGLSCQVSLEARMACGVGACLGCVIRGTGSFLTVCHDGPVFDARSVVWDQKPVV